MENDFPVTQLTWDVAPADACRGEESMKREQVMTNLQKMERACYRFTPIIAVNLVFSLFLEVFVVR